MLRQCSRQSAQENIANINPHCAVISQFDYTYNAVIRAAMGGADSLVELLLEFGAQKDIKDCSDRTALDWAIKNKRPHIEELLKK